MCTSFSVGVVGTLVCGEEYFTKENTSFILRNEQEWKDLGMKQQCVCVCERERVGQSCPTLCDPKDCSPPNSCPLDSPGRNTGVGSRSLLQGICRIQGLNPGHLHCRQILYHLSHQGSLSWKLRLNKEDVDKGEMYANPVCSWEIIEVSQCHGQFLFEHVGWVRPQIRSH